MDVKMKVKVSVKVHQSKGMTLIEVLLAIVLSSLFFYYAMGIMVTGQNYFNQVEQKTAMKSEMNRLKLFIKEEFRESKSICIYITDPDKPNSIETIDIRHPKHNNQIIEDQDYKGATVKKIVCDEDGKSIATSKARTFAISPYIKNGKQLFKILFQGQTLIESILKITINYKDNQAELEVTLYNEQNITLTDKFILDLEYKK